MVHLLEEEEIGVVRILMSRFSWFWPVGQIVLHSGGDCTSGYSWPCQSKWTYSCLYGSSTRNTRIEWLWVEVRSQFARQLRAFFYWLEHLHLLDCKNPQHLWLVHYLFLDMINSDCQDFQEEWNAHPISGEGKDRSPNVSLTNHLVSRHHYL
jgi:hypothetical protein